MKNDRKDLAQELVKLSPKQTQELRACEAAIRKGNDSFMGMCEAFSEIARKELWRGGYKRFPAYCREKWVMEPHEVSRYIKAAEVIQDLKEVTDVLPVNGGQCRVLGRLDREHRKQVWKAVVDSKEKPTSSLIERKAREAGFVSSIPTVKKESAPPKEGPSFISSMIFLANSIEGFSEDLPELEDDEIAKAKEYVTVARRNLDRLEAALLKLAG